MSAAVSTHLRARGLRSTCPGALAAREPAGGQLLREHETRRQSLAGTRGADKASKENFEAGWGSGGNGDTKRTHTHTRACVHVLHTEQLYPKAHSPENRALWIALNINPLWGAFISELTIPFAYKTS